MATIRENIQRVIDQLGIFGLVEVPGSARPDRLFFYDTLGQLAAHTRDKTHWTEDLIRDTLHGKSLRWSRRERPRPSMQVCEHEISQINHPVDELGNPLPRFFYEIDFDYAAPSSVEGIFIHGEEILVNALTGHLTNQDVVSIGLNARDVPPLPLASIVNA
jgi:hypothetical protein